MSAEKKLGDAFREFHACSEREQKYMIKLCKIMTKKWDFLSSGLNRQITF